MFPKIDSPSPTPNSHRQQYYNNHNLFTSQRSSIVSEDVSLGYRNYVKVNGLDKSNNSSNISRYENQLINKNNNSILPSRCKSKVNNKDEHQIIQNKQTGNFKIQNINKYSSHKLNTNADYPKLSGRETSSNYRKTKQQQKIKTLEEEIVGLREWVRQKNKDKSPKNIPEYKLKRRNTQIDAKQQYQQQQPLLYGNNRKRYYSEYEQGQYKQSPPLPHPKTKLMDNQNQREQLRSVSTHYFRQSPPRKYFRKEEYSQTNSPTRQSQNNYHCSNKKIPVNQNNKGIRLIKQINPYPQKKDRNTNTSQETPRKYEKKNKNNGLGQIQKLFKFKTYYYQSLSKDEQDSISSDQDVQKNNKNRHQKNKQLKQVVEDNQYRIYFPNEQDIDKMIEQYKYLTDYGRNYIPNSNPLTKYIRTYQDSPIDRQYLYFGEINRKTSLRLGFGVLITKKSILEGIWDNGGLIKGIKLQAQSLYRGSFKNSMKHGQGTCEWINGESYSGNWKNNKKDGKGRWISQSGQIYDGEWQDGLANGHGIYYSNEDGEYQGEFKNFEKHGKGHDKLPNGDQYIGNFSEGLPHQNGIYVWANKLKYQGYFNYGVRSGQGTLDQQNMFQLTGTFSADIPHGICRIKYKNNETFHHVKIIQGTISDIKNI